VKIKERCEFAHKPADYTLRGDEKVSTAIKVMAQRNIGSVVVVDDDMKVQGIVTERDLVRLARGLIGGRSPPITRQDSPSPCAFICWLSPREI
jgi:CBS domain-containing protein